MSRFAEFDNGPLLVLNVDKIVCAFISDDFDENHEPIVDLFFSNHPGEKPFRMTWAYWEVVHAKMAERQPRNTRKGM